MKTTILVLVLLGCSAVAVVAQNPTPPPASDAAANRPAPLRRPPSDPRNDAFYRLGPDSQPMEGVPRGKYSAAKIIPSQVFPGTQHTYFVYVPAQYDPSIPTAVMVFNDGQAMMAEPGDVQAHHVL